jgi:AcrR family transcriptional regulator
MSNAQETILKSAIPLFAKRGYAGTSTRAICEAAGVSKPVLYYYFRDKQHLYQELMIDTFSYYRKILLRASKFRGSLRERLTRILYEDFRAAREDNTKVRFLLRMILAPEEDLPEFNFVRELEEERDVIAAVIREGIGSGEVRGNPRKLATVLMGMELFAILENLFTGRATLTRKNAASLVDVLLEGCRVR